MTKQIYLSLTTSPVPPVSHRCVRAASKIASAGPEPTGRNTQHGLRRIAIAGAAGAGAARTCVGTAVPGHGLPGPRNRAVSSWLRV